MCALIHLHTSCCTSYFFDVQHNYSLSFSHAAAANAYFIVRIHEIMKTSVLCATAATHVHIYCAHSVFVIKIYALFGLMQLSKSHNAAIIILSFSLFASAISCRYNQNLILHKWKCILQKLENCNSIYQNNEIVNSVTDLFATNWLFCAKNNYDVMMSHHLCLWLMPSCCFCFTLFLFSRSFAYDIDILLAPIWLSHPIACRWNEMKRNEMVHALWK